MSSVFIVDNTDGTLSLTMPPGSLNGPGSGTRNTDLRIYGMGTLLWGEGVNENILRLNENWACEEKAGTPGTPQDETDLGPGRGITTPMEGQQWYNKTTQTSYVYNGTTWKIMSGIPVSNDPVDNSNVGDLWYDTLTVGGCATPAVKIYDPTHPDATPQGWVRIGSDRVSRCGDTMSGDLNMGSNSILDLAPPSNQTDAANKQYVDDRETAILASLAGHEGDSDLHLSDNQNDMLDQLEASTATLSGFTPATDYPEMGGDMARMFGFVTEYGAGATIVSELENRLRLDYTLISENTMSSGKTIVLGRDPNTGTMEAATANWVETNFGVGTVGGDRNVRFWATQPGSVGPNGPFNGDVNVNGSTIYMFAGGTWFQIYPALYS